MNKQLKLNPDGTVKSRGIEWCTHTSNPIGGCEHGCRWAMPDGTEAICYAEVVANRLAQKAYPQGFAHHYWRPQEFEEWTRLQPGDRVFVGSMADVFGKQVPAEHIARTLEEIARYPQVHFQLLTKNPKRALKFDLPRNVWLGCSIPADTMWGHALTSAQQVRMFEASLGVLAHFKARGLTTWISAEPLSWDVAAVLHGGADWMGDPHQCPAFDWIVIGAASSGKAHYAPRASHVEWLVQYCDANGVAVFMKGNMDCLPWAVANWREDFPSR